MNMESNKILAAILVAGITAYAAGMVAKAFVHPEMPTEQAYVIEAPDAPVGGGAAATPAGPEPIEDYLADADIEKGQKLVKVCAACHSFDKGGPNLVGPNLNGVVGSNVAAVSGYTYSDAMKAMGGKWDHDKLNAFLWNPKKTLPGTKMVFAGMKKPEDRAAVIKWLENQ